VVGRPGAKPRRRPLVAATPVQDLRFRAKVLLKDAKSRMPGSVRRGSRDLSAMPAPIALTDAQLSAVFDAARPLPRASRDAFLLDLAAALAGIVDPGDGDVARAIRAVQRKYFDPPVLDGRAAPPGPCML
jgi:hypothetical protein